MQFKIILKLKTGINKGTATGIGTGVPGTGTGIGTGVPGTATETAIGTGIKAGIKTSVFKNTTPNSKSGAGTRPETGIRPEIAGIAQDVLKNAISDLQSETGTNLRERED
jgi:hypothetical protein